MGVISTRAGSLGFHAAASSGSRTALSCGERTANHIFALIDGLVDQVRAEQPREAKRWPGFTTPRSGTVSMSDYTYRFPGTYQGEVDFLKLWYAQRLNFLDTNFLAKPAFHTNGATPPSVVLVELTGPPATSGA